jgi:hypothetical protein
MQFNATMLQKIFKLAGINGATDNLPVARTKFFR